MDRHLRIRVRRRVTIVTDHEAFDLDSFGFGIFEVDAVIADEGVGGDEDLAAV